MAKKKIPKVCIVCEHFSYDEGYSAYSEITPSSPPSINCAKEHFWKDLDYDLSPEEFRKILLTAQTCSDFKLRELET